jgi:hypothetical protein
MIFIFGKELSKKGLFLNCPARNQFIFSHHCEITVVGNLKQRPERLKVG